jgi:hypothetical protein
VDAPSASILQVYLIIYREAGQILGSQGLADEGPARTRSRPR